MTQEIKVPQVMRSRCKKERKHRCMVIYLHALYDTSTAIALSALKISQRSISVAVAAKM